MTERSDEVPEGRSPRHVRRPSSGRPHRALRVVLAVVAVALVAVLAFCIALGDSIRHVDADMKEVSTTYATLRDQLSSFDGEGALTSANSIADLSAAAKGETGSWLWDVAVAVPVYGHDFGAVRTMVSVSDDVAQGAVVPVVGRLAALLDDGVVGSGGSISPVALALHADEVSPLVDAIKAAGPVVARNAETVDGLGDTDSDDLDVAISQVRTTLDSLNESVGSIDSMSSTADILKAAVKLVMNG